MTGKKGGHIEQTKNYSGSIILLDATHVDTVTAHRLLGQDAGAQIHKILSRQMDGLDSSEEITEQIRRARRYEAAIKTKARNLTGMLKIAVEEFLACVIAWADGAGLAAYRHSFLGHNMVDGWPVSMLDLAFFLQEDGVGCQTGTYRECDGSVILWHTEEDVEAHTGDRFDKLRLFSFQTLDGHIATSFIYPDLLPGPTFGWRDDYFVQAIDTLHIRWRDHTAPALPNMLAWLSLYLGTQFSREELVRALGPFQGGYSISALAKTENNICVEKLDFANDQYEITHLGNAPGDFLFQTNAIYDLAMSIGIEEEISLESRNGNLDRVRRTDRLVKAIRNSEHALPFIFRMLRSHAGGDMGYSNPDVKAYLVCHMSHERTRTWVGCGPASSSNELFPAEIKYNGNY
jgi:hypothetical protein